MLVAALDTSAWRAYAAIEERWILQRYELLLEFSPECTEAADLDQRLKLAELKRRGYQFQYVLARDPQRLRGGVWQLAWIPFSIEETLKLAAVNPDFRKNEEEIKQLNKELKRHPDYERFRKAQAHLWRSPDYKEIHRFYTGQLQELQQMYSTGL